MYKNWCNSFYKAVTVEYTLNIVRPHTFIDTAEELDMNTYDSVSDKGWKIGAQKGYF